MTWGRHRHVNALQVAAFLQQVPKPEGKETAAGKVRSLYLLSRNHVALILCGSTRVCVCAVVVTEKDAMWLLTYAKSCVMEQTELGTSGRQESVLPPLPLLRLAVLP